MLQLILSLIRQFFLTERVNGEKMFLGLLPHTEDERDYQFSMLGGIFGYTPKERKNEIAIVDVKNQGSLNTCVWNSATVQKEVDEKVALSVKYIVAQARAKGRCGWTGFAQLRDAQKTLVDTGICEETLFPDVKAGWPLYSDPAQITYEMDVNAAKHKSSSFFTVTTKDEYLKAIDDGHVIHTGTTWYTGYNSANLDATAILKPRSGTIVGGHAFVCVGYDLDKSLLKFQNSFGPLWGDHGCFYVIMSDWFGGMAFPGFINLDLPQTSLWAMYEGKDVKGAGPAIYRIVNGAKCAFTSEATFNKHGGSFNPRTWIQISDSLLNSIPVGPNMI